ncbi:MAG: hypothetical protein AAGF24_16085 [Cyanobacteria bacterium P01_H01_bin.121]
MSVSPWIKQSIKQWFKQSIKRLTPICLSVVLLLSACASAPSQYDQTQQDTTGFRAEKAVDRQAKPGSTFNPFFPASADGYDVVPSQEKQGFAEYKLNRDGETFAMLTINDTVSLPAAATKYKDATDEIAGYPAVQQGSTATGILVNGRYQVKVLSRNPAFTEGDRAAWIEKFDLAGLAQVQAKIKGRKRQALLSADSPSATEEVLSPEPATAPALAPAVTPQPAA